jgi:hypothetical protein
MLVPRKLAWAGTCDTAYRWEVEINGHHFDLDAVRELLEPEVLGANS